MGKCQSQPPPVEPELVIKQVQIEKSPKKQKQTKKIQTDEPTEDFAVPVNQVPDLTIQAKDRLVQLGPFDYEKCGKYKHGTLLQPYKLANGSIYVGEWINGKTNGKGKYYLPDQSLFEGISVENQIQGYGRIIHSNGDYFEGQVKNSRANGEGIYVEDKITYKGKFKDNLQHGQGIEYSDLYEFKGFFKEGEKQKGTLILKNKQKYEYNGEFKNNKFHGYGTLVNDVGTYEGKFQYGQKNGFGKFTWIDGSYFSGRYRNDQKQGEGKLYNKKGTLIKQGFWQKNKFIN